MTNTYSDVYTKANSKDCSVQEFYDILWQYVEDEMIKILKSGHVELQRNKKTKNPIRCNVDIKLIKTLVNYSGNSFGAHAMLLDMALIKSLYENISWFILNYADAHKDSCKNTHYCYCFEDSMDVYMSARKTKKVIADKIRDNPLIQNLYENGHHTFADKAVRLLIKDDEENKSANKAMQEALYNMRAYDFFRILKKVVKELGE